MPDLRVGPYMRFCPRSSTYVPWGEMNGPAWENGEREKEDRGKGGGQTSVSICVDLGGLQKVTSPPGEAVSPSR